MACFLRLGWCRAPMGISRPPGLWHGVQADPWWRADHPVQLRQFRLRGWRASSGWAGAEHRWESLGHQAYGTVFKLTPGGALTTLYSFGNFGSVDGVLPQAGLVQSTDGNLYGTTAYVNSLSGPSGYGTVFRLAPDGSSFATLVSFDGCNDGAHPAAALVEDMAGNLY